MKRLLTLFAVLGLAVCGTHAAKAVTLIGGSTNNGNMDLCVPDEITTGFFLPKPATWLYSGSRTLTGAYRDGLSSEPWSGPAPTPVTADGLLNAPFPEGCDGPDCGVFFKAFTGDLTNGPATVNLSQTLPATPGASYTFSGWAGAESNMLGTGQFEIQFLNAASTVIGGNALNLNTAGLFVANGQPFNYKNYSVAAVAPAGTASIKVLAELINGIPNPLGGGQAFVVDDLNLSTNVPEPTSIMLGSFGVLGLLGMMRRRG